MNDEVIDVKETEEMPVVLGADNLVQMAEAAEKRVQAILRIKRAALSVTSKHDWVDQNGKPYLQVSGSEKVARLFGISWQVEEPQFSIEEDGHFSYTYKGAFTIGSTPPIDFIGSRGSKDPFFSKSHGNDIPPSEIDKNDVRKAAFTNLLGNGITRLLGLRNLTWEEVKGAGINTDSVSKVDYKKTEMSEDAKEQRKQIGEWLMEMALDDKDKASALLEQFTAFEAKDGKQVKGKTSLKYVSEKATPVTYGKVQKAYEEWKEGKDIADEYEKKEKGGK